MIQLPVLLTWFGTSASNSCSQNNFLNMMNNMQLHAYLLLLSSQTVLRRELFFIAEANLLEQFSFPFTHFGG